MATGIALEQLLAARTSSSVFPGYVTLIQALPSTLGEYHSAPSTWEDTMPTTAPRTIVNYRVQLKKYSINLCHLLWLLKSVTSQRNKPDDLMKSVSSRFRLKSCYLFLLYMMMYMRWSDLVSWIKCNLLSYHI